MHKRFLLCFALFLPLVVSCDTIRSAEATAPRVASVHDVSTAPPALSAEVLVQMASCGQNPGTLLGLTSEGQVWRYYGAPYGWQKILDNRANPVQFISITGTVNGETYASDASGQVWRWWGEWVPFDSPGMVSEAR